MFGHASGLPFVGRMFAETNGKCADRMRAKSAPRGLGIPRFCGHSPSVVTHAQ